jgi:hypothetical protein
VHNLGDRLLTCQGFDGGLIAGISRNAFVPLKSQPLTNGFRGSLIGMSRADSSSYVTNRNENSLEDLQ